MSGASRATRSRMSSRRSSPFVNAPKDPRTALSSSEGLRDPKKTATDAWVEPDLPQPAPSFVGDKLLRQGVLENMLPLGSLPSGRARPKARVEGTVFQSTPLRNGEEIVIQERPVTHALSPSPHQNYTIRDSEERGTRSFKSRSRGEEEEEEEDDEYRPTAIRRPSLFVNKMATTSTPTTAPQFTTPLIRPDIVQKAAQHLRSEDRIHVADALEQAFSESQSDANVTAIFDAILSNEPSRQHASAFKRLIKGFAPSTGKKSRRRLENSQSTRPAHSTSSTARKSRRQSTPQQIVNLSTRPSPNHINNDLNQPLKSNPIVNSESITVDSINAVNRGTTSINGHGLLIKGPFSSTLSTSRPSHLHISHPLPLPSITVPSSSLPCTYQDTSTMADDSTLHDHSASPGPSNGAMAESSEVATKKRARSSSTSSLSSLDSRINDLAPGIENGDLNPGGSGADVGTEAEGSSSSQPPAKRRKSLGPKVGAATKRAAKSKGKTGVALEKEQQKEKIREHTEKLRETFANFARERAGQYPIDFDQRIPVSNVRGPPPSKRHQQSSITQNGSASVSAPNSFNIPSFVDQVSRTMTPSAAGSNLLNGMSRKRFRDDSNVDVIETPTLAAPLEPPLIVNGVELPSNARPVTPKIPPRPASRAEKRTTRSARILVSPYKRNGYPSVTAGVPRGVETEASGGNGASGGSGSAQDNFDTCSACSGSGTLLCCDGCPRSFHFACCDPPIHPDNPPAGEWLCVVCEQKPPPPPSASESRMRNGGIFAALLPVLDKQSPVAFALPSEYREYFEGVKTGDDGEFEATNNGRILETVLKPKRKLGPDEVPAPDNLKLRDENGNLVQCFGCQEYADGVREITYCDYCPMRWHTDCLEPPQAFDPHQPKPNLELDGLPEDQELLKKRYSERVGWKCPLHADHALATVGNTGRGYSFEDPEFHARVAAGEHLRVPKLRRPKQNKIVDPGIRRGYRNNGLIELDMMPDDYQFGGMNDNEMNGIIYRVSEYGLRLDFINRTQRDRMTRLTLEKQATIAAQKAQEVASQTAVAAAAETAKNLAGRPIIEQQAALNLAQLAKPNVDLTLTGDRVEGLLNAVIAEAPPDVMQSIGNSRSVDLDDLHTLLALQELINAKVGALLSSNVADTSATPTSAAGPSNARAASPTSSEVADTSATAAVEVADASAAAAVEAAATSAAAAEVADTSAPAAVEATATSAASAVKVADSSAAAAVETADTSGTVAVEVAESSAAIATAIKAASPTSSVVADTSAAVDAEKAAYQTSSVRDE